MNKAEKKFRLYAIFVTFILLTSLLSVINGVNFTMAASDADKITQMLADRQGNFSYKENAFGNKSENPWDGEFKMGPMGPDSPEMYASIRYFTIAFSEKSEQSETVAFNVSTVTQEEAQDWAKTLIKEKTGWTRGTYRYRVYKNHGIRYVTVIDFGRELLPSFRILIISAVGELICLIIGWFVLLGIGKKIYAPIEEVDRKQRSFIKNANKEFRVPLAIINGNTELTAIKYGPDDETRSTHQQIEKLNKLVDKLSTVGIFDDEDMSRAEVPVSEFLSAALDRKTESFASSGLDVTVDIAPNIILSADREAISRMFDELVDNALKYSLTNVTFTLKQENGYILFETRNDTNLPDGPVNQIFDRFTTLENRKENSAGLGLSYVKEIVKAHNGRISATVFGGIFSIRITL